MAEKRPEASGEIKTITNNRKARHDYHILETIEAGIELRGTEVKSLRAGRVNLKDGYVDVRDLEMYLVGVHISPYEEGNRFNHDPERPRRLLLHRREILKFGIKARDKGLTLVPLRMYFRGARVKVEIGLARGKKQYDKREAIANRDAKRAVQRALKEARNR
jgi:SsrA-binding protein